MNRDNDYRTMEKVLAWVPFAPKVEARDVGRALRIEAEIRLEGKGDKLDSTIRAKKEVQSGGTSYTYENGVIKDLIRHFT